MMTGYYRVLKYILAALCIAFGLVRAGAQTLTPITKPGVEVSRTMKLFNGLLYYSTVEGEKGFKIWTCDVATKKSHVLMKTKQNISHFFVADKTLLFSLSNGKDGEDGMLYYIDEHGKPKEVVMKNEAGPDVEPATGRHLEVYPFKHGFLIMAPVRDMKARLRLYRFAPKQDSATRLMPEDHFVRPGLVVSPDGKILIASVEILPPHPWENTKAFWNQFSQLYLLREDGEPFVKWMDHAELYDANFKYTKRTWINLHYKELKDKTDDRDRHMIYIITAPSENKGTMPREVGEAVDSSLFICQGKASYYYPRKGNIYLTVAFEYPKAYHLKYAKLNGLNMSDFDHICGQYMFDDAMYIITKHKGSPAYYDAWAMHEKFDTAEWLEAHTFFKVNYDAKLSSTLPKAVEFKTFNDTTGNPIYLQDGPNGQAKLYTLDKGGAKPRNAGGQGWNELMAFWHGNVMMKQKQGGDVPDQLALNCKTGTGNICSPGDAYQQGYDFEVNNQLFFTVFTAQTRKLINWHSDGTLEGTTRLDIGNLALQLDFSRPYIDGNNIFLFGRDGEKTDAKDGLYVLEVGN